MSLFRTPVKLDTIFERIFSGGKKEKNVPVNTIDDSYVTKRRRRVNGEILNSVSNYDLNVSSQFDNSLNSSSNSNVIDNEKMVNLINSMDDNSSNNSINNDNLFAVIENLLKEVDLLKVHNLKQQHTIELQSVDIARLNDSINNKKECCCDCGRFDDIGKINSRINRLQNQMNDLSSSVDDFEDIAADFNSKNKNLANKFTVFDENFPNRANDIVVNYFHHLGIIEKINNGDKLVIGKTDLRLHHNLEKVINSVHPHRDDGSSVKNNMKNFSSHTSHLSVIDSNVVLNGNGMADMAVNDFNFNCRIVKFNLFSKCVKVMINDFTTSLIDDNENMMTIKRKLFNYLNNINEFKICSSIDNIFVRKINYNITGSRKILNFIIFYVTLDFPLNSQFFEDCNVNKFGSNELAVRNMKDINNDGFFRKFKFRKRKYWVG